MKKLLLCLLCLSCLTFMTSYAFAENTTEGEHAVPKKISRFSFRQVGTMWIQLPVDEITRGDDATIVRFEDMRANNGGEQVYVTITEPAALMETIEKIVSTYNAESWNGFHKSDPTILDGFMFTLEIEFADGTVVKARGTNAFPTGYNGFAKEIAPMYEALREKCVAQYPDPKE